MPVPPINKIFFSCVVHHSIIHPNRYPRGEDPVKMKFILATIVSLVSAVAAHETSPSFLRKSNVEQESACNNAPNRDSCFAMVDEESGMPCSWCVAGAIPSKCVTQEQAKQLPEAVFECSSPGQTVFSFVEDRSHTFFSKENDICDPSSKSLSGYMDIKGSEYDKNSQNKHLFYWMFEKRGDIDENTPFIVSSFGILTQSVGVSNTVARRHGTIVLYGSITNHLILLHRVL